MVDELTMAHLGELVVVLPGAVGHQVGVVGGGGVGHRPGGGVSHRVQATSPTLHPAPTYLVHRE